MSLRLDDPRRMCIKIFAEYVVSCADDELFDALDGLTGNDPKDAETLRLAFNAEGRAAAATIMEVMRDNGGSYPRP
ncbi:MAG: hypothetical protein Q8Q14_16505 [Gemmatimonadales bacterium]|nr:hypothetical protein [Gemmatimonadales bacterium]